jgi:protein farnesyltransferase/geranylgeranyltransferase type-1 subunit alpha
MVGMAEEEENEFVSFKLRPEWNGVVPIPQDDGPHPPVPIAYSPEFTETMDYFRAVLQSDERSERSLALTKEVISCNSANYTAWYFRRIVLEDLKRDLTEEFTMTEDIASVTPKNYQLWFHRRWLVEKLNDFSREFEFTKSVLLGDSKNYHSWAHRQWVVQHFHLAQNEESYEAELAFVEEMIQSDVRNNSAWNYRFYLVRSRFPSLTALQLEGEVDFAWKFVLRSPNNQSSWGYLRGVLKENWDFLIEKVERLCLELTEKHKFCSNAFSLLFDIYVHQHNDEKAIAMAEKLLSLPTMYQKKYWEFRLGQLKSNRA